MRRVLFLLAAATLALRADDPGSSPVIPLSTNVTVTPAGPVDDATASHQGYPSGRYESLWTKSPFAVETPDEEVQETVDYSLVGVAQIDGVSYASLIETRNQDHKLVRSDRPTDGLIVKSITKKENGDTYAIVNRDGQSLTLKLQTAAEGAPASPNVTIPQNVPNMPGTMTPNIPMPGSGSAPGSTPIRRPLIRIHRPVIHVPQRTDTTAAPVAPAAAPGDNAAPAPAVGQPPPPPPPAQ